MNDSDPEFLLVREVAARLRVTPQFITRLARSGEIPAHRLGKHWRIDRVQFERWWEGKRVRKRQAIPITYDGPIPYGVRKPQNQSDLLEQVRKRTRKLLAERRERESGG